VDIAEAVKDERPTVTKDQISKLRMRKKIKKRRKGSRRTYSATEMAMVQSMSSVGKTDAQIARALRKTRPKTTTKAVYQTRKRYGWGVFGTNGNRVHQNKIADAMKAERQSGNKVAKVEIVRQAAKPSRHKKEVAVTFKPDDGDSTELRVSREIAKTLIELIIGL